MEGYELASTVRHTVLNMQVYCAPCLLLRERKCWGLSGFYFKQHKAYRTTTELRAFCCVYGLGSLWWRRRTGPRTASWCPRCQGGGPFPPIWKCSSPHRAVHSACALHSSCRWRESESRECLSGRWCRPLLHLDLEKKDEISFIIIITTCTFSTCQCHICYPWIMIHFKQVCGGLSWLWFYTSSK